MNPRMRPWLTEDDKQAVQRVLDGGDLMSGRLVEEFERALAERFKRRHVVCLASGTAALEAAFAATGDGRIIHPEHFVAMESASHAAFGAQATVAETGTRTDVLGQKSPVQGRVHDCSHTVTARGDVAVFSFNQNKFIACVGGALATDDGVVAAFARQYRNHGREGELSFRPGRNLRMGEINAALGLSQLKRLDDILERRRMVANWYATHAGSNAYGDGLFLFAVNVAFGDKPIHRSLKQSFGVVRTVQGVAVDCDLLPVWPLMTNDDVLAVWREANQCS